MRLQLRPHFLFVFLILGIAACSTSTDDPTFSNPYDPILGEGLPVPDSVQVQVGNNVVRLSWALPEGETADKYAIFRKRLDSETVEPERLIDEVTETFYSDTRVRNSRVYAYRLAAGVGEQFGRRTAEIEARPGLFTILLANDAEVTRERTIAVTVNAPNTEVVQFSEDPDNFDSPWRAVSGQISITLSQGDGDKTVYARFRLQDGSESVPVFDAIKLDTKAVISLVEYDGPDTRKPGDSVHFRLDAGEMDGSATAEVDEILSSFRLFDDGSGGDVVAGDGIYERDMVIPIVSVAVDKAVRGSFTDLAGNQAETITASRKFSVREGPESVDLIEGLTAEPPDPPSITLRWSESRDPNFSAYRVFRSQGAQVDSTDRLLTTITGKSTLEFKDTDVVESQTYNYRVYVLATFGLETGSNQLPVTVPNLRPPGAVTLQSPNAVSETRVSIDWSRASDLDFASYRVYRNGSGAVNETDILVTEIFDSNVNFFDDSGLTENTAYFYRVFTMDQGDLFSRSNEVEAKTKNQAPPAVVMNAATDVDSTSATLSWTESGVHDFDKYRLFRAEIPTVTTSSTLVVEIDESSSVSFRDIDLLSGTTYYYRVFVQDNADPDSKSTGSNTVTVLTP